MTQNSRIAFIGGGNMAQSLADGLIGAGWPPGALAFGDPDPVQRERLARFAPGAVTANAAAAAAGARVVVLAVKPQVAIRALAEVAAVLRRERPLLLSVAAGLGLDTIGAAIGVPLAMARAMPNVAVSLRRGASAFYVNAQADAEDRALVRGLLEAVGTAIEVEEESLLDVATAVSGSGPAYFFLLVEALAAAGAAAGLAPESARALAAAAGTGAMALLAAGGGTAGALRERVTSPGGTTAAALAEFARGDFRGLVARAVNRAAERARELADG